MSLFLLSIERSIVRKNNIVSNSTLSPDITSRSVSSADVGHRQQVEGYSNQDGFSSCYHQQRPRPPTLPLSINKIYRRMYANGNNCVVGISTGGDRSPPGGVILRQYLIPRNPNSRLLQLHKELNSDSKSGLIPASAVTMGAFLDKPRTEKCNESGEGGGLRFGIATMQGWRIEMEDAHTARAGADLPAPWTDWSFFAVFDGHAGGNVARYCAANLINIILNTASMRELSLHLPLNKLDTKHVSTVLDAMKEGFLLVDAKMRELPELSGDNERSGSTAVCCLVSPSHLFIANLGDSRALVSRNGQVHFATEDHKPYLPKERERIVNAGGSVMIQRVNGSLAVSRALGDYEYKSVHGLDACRQLVSPEPDLHVIERDLSHGGGVKDEFVLLACDGVFDVMNNHELCDFVRSRLRVTDRLELICNQILDSCLSKGSKDNMSVILVTFPGAPQVSNDAVDKERELETRLRERIYSIINICDSDPDRDEIDADRVLQLLMTQEIPGVPPGAGLHAMRPMVESILESMMTSSVSSVKSGLADNAHQQSPTRSAKSPTPVSPSQTGSSSPLSPKKAPASPFRPSTPSSGPPSPGETRSVYKTLSAASTASPQPHSHRGGSPTKSSTQKSQRDVKF